MAFIKMTSHTALQMNSTLGVILLLTSEFMLFGPPNLESEWRRLRQDDVGQSKPCFALWTTPLVSLCGVQDKHF